MINAVTVKPASNAPCCASGLVTVTSLVPVVASCAITIRAVRCVAELNVQLVVVMPAPKSQVAPD